jgi:tetratricopeptide (TPR) repeat protein
MVIGNPLAKSLWPLRTPGLCWFLLLLWSSAHAAAEQSWTEVRSPHFTVLTDGGDKDARRVARELEQIRGALSEVFPGIRLDSGVPLLVLAPHDEEGMKKLAPAIWKQKGAKPAGFFHHGWDKEFAVVRLDTIQPGAYEVVYHEYVHSVMHRNLRWLPTWLDEGLADFYANTRFEAKRMMIGVPSVRINVVRGQALIPLDVLFKVNPASPYYHDEDKVGRFYAESWALTQYLTFGEGMQSGQKMLQFANLLQKGGDQKKIFEQVFGDTKKVQTDLENYLRRPAFNTGVLNNPPHTDESDFVGRKLGPAESAAELASYFLWLRDWADARQMADRALKDDPQLGLAHEDVAFLDLTDGKDEDAIREFTQAVKLDDKLYLSAFSLAMLAPPADPESLREALRKTIAVNPQFAPPYVQLALISLRQGDFAQALTLARKAEQLEPARAGYHILTGQILLRMGHGAEAAAFAQYVADRWINPDHDEAVELWNSVPVSQRPADAQVAMTPPPEGTQTVEGKIKTASCGSKDDPMTIVIDHDGQEVRFISKGPFRSGFSDTLWWGRDHFNPCRHVVGLKAVVRYKAAADRSSAAEIVEYYLRDDLPPLAPPKDAKSGAEAAPKP